MIGLRALTFMLEYIKKNIFLPGQIENWIVLVDLDNLSLLNVPFKSLKLYLQTMQNQFRCTSRQVFIVGISMVFNFMWNTAKHFLDEHTRKKIVLTKSLKCEELIAMFEPH